MTHMEKLQDVLNENLHAYSSKKKDEDVLHEFTIQPTFVYTNVCHIYEKFSVS
jgi:hypothetical protein